MTLLSLREKYAFDELFHAPLRRSGGLLDDLMAGSNVTLTLQGETDWTFTLRNSRSTINQVKRSCGVSSPASRQQDRAEVSPPAPANGPLPQLVQAHLDEMDGMCKDSGGRLKGTDRALLTADFNRDGQTDYAIAHGAFMCTNFASMFTVSGGSNVTLFVSVPNGYREVLSRGSYGVRVEGRKLWLGLAGPACGYLKTAKSEARACERALTWNNARRQMEFTDIIHRRP
ncbi:hypothetical protein U5801_06500 [Lamprobacter modestohalophilus]|uniref:hypothetical protein n=1 Tax=Lamprobacter modestohalophilus TaxID=1064514 RepID=UPI002ADEC59D|nr:hypothetical protein [Lamprobacter modestohalophilus]MEA1049453.1 hypothetical protein [Lamprobacter modestohalophilus]